MCPLDYYVTFQGLFPRTRAPPLPAQHEGGTLHFGRNLQVGREPAFWEEILDSNFIEILQV